MDDTSAAAQVWAYLERRGCERTCRMTPTLDGPRHHVEIHLWGRLIAQCEHAEASLANSGALLDAIRMLGPQR